MDRKVDILFKANRAIDITNEERNNIPSIFSKENPLFLSNYVSSTKIFDNSSFNVCRCLYL